MPEIEGGGVGSPAQRFLKGMFRVLAEVGVGARGVRAVRSPSRRGHLGAEGLRRALRSRDQRQREGAPRLGGEQGSEEAERGVRGVRDGGVHMCVTGGRACVCAHVTGDVHVCVRVCVCVTGVCACVCV